MERRKHIGFEKEPNEPSPEDFIAYLPWLCYQLQVPAAVAVKKVQRDEYVSVIKPDKSKTKNKYSLIPPAANIVSSSERTISSKTFGVEEENREVIKIEAVYCGDNLVQIKFNKNKNISNMVIKVIGLILQFHLNLHCININSGLNQNSLYELSKLLPVNNITDICLDDTFLPEANYYVLLDNPSHLKQLSLCRCKIDNLVVEMIASKLSHPKPASKTLSILNLSTNRITDEGATFLAKALRSNRQLSYLNLSCNMISDIGAGEILNVLKQFPLNQEEILDSKAELIKFLRLKNNMIYQMLLDYKAECKKPVALDNKKKAVKITNANTGKKVKGLENVRSMKFHDNNVHSKDSNLDAEKMFLKKAESIALKYFGNSKDPFSDTQTEIKHGVRFSFGNNVLCYLNLAYNNLSYLTLKKLLSVLVAQDEISRVPRGLINVSIEGNPMPIDCDKLDKIDTILRLGLSNIDKQRISKKKLISSR